MMIGNAQVPKVIFSCIFSYLDVKGLANSRAVCKLWLEVVKQFSSYQFQKDFFTLPENNLNIREVYQQKLLKLTEEQALVSSIKVPWTDHVFRANSDLFIRRAGQSGELKIYNFKDKAWKNFNPPKELRTATIGYMTQINPQKFLVPLGENKKRVLSIADLGNKSWKSFKEEDFHFSNRFVVNSNTALSWASYEDYSLYLLDLNEVHVAEKMEEHNGIISNACKISKIKIATSSCDKTVKCWDLNQGKSLNTLTGHEQEVLGVQCMNESQLATFSYDRTVRIWDLRTNKCSQFYQHETAPMGIEVIDSYTLSSWNRNMIRLWDMRKGFENTIVDYNDYSTNKSTVSYVFNDKMVWWNGVRVCVINIKEEKLIYESNIEINGKLSSGHLYSWNAKKEALDLYAFHLLS